MAPCLHTTCGGCLADWFQKHLDCPTCRAAVTTVSKAFQQKNTIEMLLEVKPDLQQSSDDRSQLDAKNIFRQIDKFVVGKDSLGSPKALVKTKPLGESDSDDGSSSSAEESYPIRGKRSPKTRNTASKAKKE